MHHDLFIIPVMFILAVLATWPIFHHRYVIHKRYFDEMEKLQPPITKPDWVTINNDNHL